MAVGGIYGRLSRGKREEGEGPASKHQIDDSAWVWRMSGLRRDGTSEPIARDQFSGANGEREKLIFPVQLDHD